MKEFHIKSAPFFNSNKILRKPIINVLIALLPIILFNCFRSGNNLTFIIVLLLTTFLVEIGYSFIANKEINKSIIINILQNYNIIPVLLLGIILPAKTPVLLVIIGGIIEVVFSKISQHFLKRNILNPALISRILIILLYFIFVSKNLYMFNNSMIISNNVLSFRDLFSTGGINIILCLFAYVYLTITKTIKWKIPAVYVACVLVLTGLIGNINNLGFSYSFLQVFSSSLLFVSIFIATEEDTSPVTGIGQILYGLFLGILTVIIRYLTPISDGVLLSILIMNMWVYVLDIIGAVSRFEFKKSIVLFLLAWLLIIFVGLFIGLNYNNLNYVDDYKIIVLRDNHDIREYSEFEIISRKCEDNVITYVVKQKGVDDILDLQFIIKYNSITSITILNQNESGIQKIIDDNYITRIIEKQYVLDDIESNNKLVEKLKNAVIEVKKDYNKYYQ